MSDALKLQRDRFLAFAFASADLFLEVGADETITYVRGAARSITGVEDSALLGKPWLEIFSVQDRPTLVSVHAKAKPVQRCGPLLVTLAPAFGDNRRAVLTAIQMPGSAAFYLTLGFTGVLTARAAEFVRESQDKELLDKDSFLRAARESLTMAKSLGQDLDLTLLDIADVATAKKSFSEEAWETVGEEIGALLRTRSVDGRTAAQIAEGRYSVIHDKDVDSDVLRAQVESLLSAHAPEGETLSVSGRKVTADLASLSEKDASKALVYTINEFERKGAEMTIETLNNGFQAYFTANAQKVVALRSIIRDLGFGMHFQPIVSLAEGYEAVHYEMLARFHDQGSTIEWIMFAEDMGLAADFDKAVLDRAINYVKHKAAGQKTKFAVNISGQSIQSDIFFEEMRAKIKDNKTYADRLIFEITESSEIGDLEKVNKFIQILRGEGYKVCLDDFGAGSASFQYLHTLHVDYLKIDGQYTRRILESERDSIMVKNLIAMCKDLKVKVVAEMVEGEAEAERLRNLGADYGQGYYFSRPTPKPDYTPPRGKTSA